MIVDIVDSTPWDLLVEVDGRAAKLSADAAARPGLQPDFVVYRSRDQTWADGRAMTPEDRDEILALLPEAAAKRGWTIEVSP
jgi:hypothetical protein